MKNIKTPNNIEIMPGSLLSSKNRWRALSKKMPSGSCLLITFKSNPGTDKNIIAIAKAFLDSGRMVRILKM